MNLFALATFASVGINCHASFIVAGELTVTPESNTGVGGFMFDVEANQVMDVTIDTILFNFNAGKGSYEYGLWYKEGSFVGYNTDESAWTPACSGNSIEQARLSDFNSATTKRDCSFTIPAGQTYGVYIHGLSRGLIVEEEGSSFDDIVASDDNIKVYTGLAVARTYGPFGKGYGDDYYVTPTVKLMYTALLNDEPDELPCSIEVRSVDHKFGPSVAGKYFNFYHIGLDMILGRTDWSNERLVTDKGTVVVWRVPNGGSVGDAHGRFDRSAKKGDWSVGDEITFLDCSTNDIEPEPIPIPCKGCFADYDDVDSVQETVDGISSEIFSLFLAQSVSIEFGAAITVVSAQMQVVAGSNYRVTLNIGSRSNVVIQYYVALPYANPNQVPSHLQLLNEGQQSKAKQGETCKDGGILNGLKFSFERECEEGLVCTPKTDFVEIVGEVPHTCQLPIKPCLGCFTDYDDLDSVQETVDGISDKIFALFKARSKIPVENGARLTVVSAQSQVVAGTNFRVTLNVGSQENVIIQYFIALPYANPDRVPSNIQLIDEGHQYEAKAGELCREGGVEKGFLFERNCEKGLVCLPQKGVVAIGGEVPYTCQFA